MSQLLMKSADCSDIADTVANDPLVGLSRRVMQQVYFIYAVRQFKTPLVIKMASLCLIVICMTVWVSLGDVFMNLYSTTGIVGTPKFLYSAFMDTDWSVEVLSSLIFVLAVWVLYDFARSLISHMHFLGHIGRLEPHKA